MNNPILKTLKENDLVLIEVPSIESYNLKEIVKISNLKLDDDNGWLDFDAEVLYTNTKMHKSMLNEAHGNCMAISETVDPLHLIQFARLHDMWKPDKFLMSDAELESKQLQINNLLWEK